MWNYENGIFDGDIRGDPIVSLTEDEALACISSKVFWRRLHSSGRGTASCCGTKKTFNVACI